MVGRSGDRSNHAQAEIVFDGGQIMIRRGEFHLAQLSSGLRETPYGHDGDSGGRENARTHGSDVSDRGRADEARGNSDLCHSNSPACKQFVLRFANRFDGFGNLYLALAEVV